MNKMYKIIAALTFAVGLILGSAAQAEAAVVITPTDTDGVYGTWGLAISAFGTTTSAVQIVYDDGGIVGGTDNIVVTNTGASAVSVPITLQWSPSSTRLGLVVNGALATPRASGAAASTVFGPGAYQDYSLTLAPGASTRLSVAILDGAGRVYGFVGSLTAGTPTSSGTGGAVPEPATLVLLGTGLVGLMGARRKRKSLSSSADSKST